MMRLLSFALLFAKRMAGLDQSHGFAGDAHLLVGADDQDLDGGVVCGDDAVAATAFVLLEIGRASCRERV